MHRILRRHPESSHTAVERIEADVTRAADSLALHFVVTGKLGGLAVPSPAQPVHTDELWRHTCFEAFIRLDAGYIELNFSPSGAWAAYRFDGYRQGMRKAEIPPPLFKVRSNDDQLELAAIVVLDEADQNSPWRLALSAVTEEVDGALSYWALTHAPGKPDFHHADGFALEIEP